VVSVSFIIEVNDLIENCVDYIINYMFILGYRFANMCFGEIFNNKCEYNFYLCMDNQMCDHNIWWHTKCITLK